MNKKITETIRQIATYHSGDGTSGYCLSEKQFEKIFRLFDAQKQEIRDDIRKKIKNMGHICKDGKYCEFNEARNEIFKII